MKCEKCGHENEQKKEEFNFGEIYKKYPKKVGKSIGFKKLRASVKTIESYELLSVALERFLAFHREKGTTKQYYPYFSTWATSWMDWSDIDAGKSHIEGEIKPIEELLK